MKEIEVKARVCDKTLLLNNLAKLGIVFSEPIIQRDVIFFPKGMTPDGQSKEKALRIREQDGLYIFTYKQPNKNNLDKIEHESRIEDPEAMSRICEELGFEEFIRINKVRRKAVHREYEICFDEIENLGTYIEVEKMSSDGDSEQIQNELFEFMRSFGIAENDRVYEGYDILLHKNRLTIRHTQT